MGLYSVGGVCVADMRVYYISSPGGRMDGRALGHPQLTHAPKGVSRYALTLCLHDQTYAHLEANQYEHEATCVNTARKCEYWLVARR